MYKSSLIIFAFAWYIVAFTTSCANIIPPSGGPRDTIPPVLVAATPADSATNVAPGRITLQFNEFVEVQNAFQNVIVSPLPVNTPNVDYRLRNVTVRLRDTLEPNTTYSINFGNAIKDVNEGNVLENFTYVFSTGNRIDDNTLTGRVVMAETGGVDSTLLVVLHRNLADSAVAKERPRYITRLDGAGNFIFRHLPYGTFAVYALPDDFSRRYDDTTKPFAFVNEPVRITDSVAPITLYAYQHPKLAAAATTPGGGRLTTAAAQQDKVLRYSTNLEGGSQQDLLKDLELVFNKAIFEYDTNRIVFTDTNFVALANWNLKMKDPTHFTFSYPWRPNQQYFLLLPKESFEDSTGLTLPKNDTLKISTKREEDYGSIKLRFNNLDFTRNPVLQFVQNNEIVESVAITQRDWSRRLFPPGEYQLRILFDTNKNLKWDHGNFFGEKRQPEIVRDLNIKLAIRGNWDNEREITF